VKQHCPPHPAYSITVNHWHAFTALPKKLLHKDRQRERERERGRLDADGQRVCRQSNIVRSEGKRKGRKG